MSAFFSLRDAWDCRDVCGRCGLLLALQRKDLRLQREIAELRGRSQADRERSFTVDHEVIEKARRVQPGVNVVMIEHQALSAGDGVERFGFAFQRGGE